MLRIYPVTLDMLRDVRPLADAIAGHDRDHARQLRRSALSVVLNMAEGAGHRGGTKKVRYRDALGSAQETLANLDAAEAIGFVPAVGDALRDRIDHIIRVLVKLTR